MIMRAFLLLALLAVPTISASATADDRPPNIVLIFTDDQGYADVGVFGAKGFETPHLDRMAAEGRTFTSFYAAQAVCSASRAALLTGCYPNRIGIIGALGPGAPIGLNPDEITIAELLKPLGYATAIFGKWHLGDASEFLPTRHGFDEYFGLPYSNDMWPKHPTNPARYPPLPLIEGEEVIALDPDQRNLTTWYTERAVSFIEANADQPFFLYVPHNMPHVPLFVSDKFEGQSEQGLYGDVIMEIDWSVGQILDAIRRQELSERTLVIFTSDNGPWLSYGDHAGSAGPFREGKGTTFDGGQREPTIAWWPGQIPAGSSSDEPAMTIDILPTIASLTGAELPDHPIDGLDISPMLLGESDARSPHQALAFYWGRELQAVRSGQWKLHFPHRYQSLDGPPGSGGRPGPYIIRETGLALFDLVSDPGETTDLKDDHPEVVERLKALAEQIRADLGDSATDRQGEGVRPPGQL